MTLDDIITIGRMANALRMLSDEALDDEYWRGLAYRKVAPRQWKDRFDAAALSAERLRRELFLKKARVA